MQRGLYFGAVIFVILFNVVLGILIFRPHEEGLPANAHWIATPTPVTSGPYLSSIPTHDVIFASTSLHLLRAQVLSTTTFTCPAPTSTDDPCWTAIDDTNSYLYVAVFTLPQCTRTATDGFALSSTTLYFVHSLSPSNAKVCTMLLARPQYHLYLLNRGLLPTNLPSLQVATQEDGQTNFSPKSSVTLP